MYDDFPALDLRDLIAQFIGHAVIIRAPGGFSYVGRLVAASPRNLVLREAAWVADSGRWSVAVASTGLPASAEVEAWPADSVVVIDRPAGMEVSRYLGAFPLETQ